LLAGRARESVADVAVLGTLIILNIGAVTDVIDEVLPLHP
jgi:hypothetical protein